MAIDFSVLLPVWAGDDPARLRIAFLSAVNQQQLRPSEVVIVRDGPVGPGLDDTIAELTRISLAPVTVVALPVNVGLGRALDAGLAACAHDVVARMDADDIAVATRFARQIPLMAHADIVGAGLIEFEGEVGHVVGRRVPPTGDDAIARYARVHDPFNHPTVVYRRTAVLAAGGYGDLDLMEDYWLFARMLAAGATAVNLAEPLVHYRVGADAYRRRGGLRLLRSEVALQRRFRDEGFTSRAQYARNVVLRGGYRLVPWWLRRAMYVLAVPAFRTLRYGKPTSTGYEAAAVERRALPTAGPRIVDVPAIDVPATDIPAADVAGGPGADVRAAR